MNEKASGTDKDALKLVGLYQTDIEFERPAADLTDIIIRTKATGETFTLDNQFDKEDGVEKIIFADDSVLGGNDWSLDGILSNLASIVGTAGNDTINGYASKNDVIIGKGDNDTLKGLAGSDTFVFGTGFGHDTILDFTAGAGTDDVLRFETAVFADFTAVMSVAAQSGADTVNTYDPNNTITLKSVTVSNLHQDDFIFI
ncbi:MAG: hypothetical protein M9944_03535 [Rhizobiaceae bacterium]|nr:hypothetical protein [Rhizobiaceae bacterium]